MFTIGMTCMELEEWIAEEIKRFVDEDEDNRMTGVDGAPFFDEPLVGFAPGDDPIFEVLKGVIGEFHLTPYEIMAHHCHSLGRYAPDASEIGVISFVLPITKTIKDENSSMEQGPSERWSHTRLFGEMFNKKLQKHVVKILEEMGHLAGAPEQMPDLYRTVEDPRVGKASTWSERHVAFICGLGTFGISDGLITARGKAHRVGSVVVDIPFTPPERPDDIHSGCLYYQKQDCMVCAKRCPVGAISEEGHDKERCSEFVYSREDMVRERYGIDIYGCGLCQTGVPCESRDPVRKSRS